MNTRIAKGPALLPIHVIEDLEEELVTALYEQRSLERRIMEYSPQTSAPCELKDSFCRARVRVNQIEMQIRMQKYKF
jgi:hypothetical protein